VDFREVKRRERRAPARVGFAALPLLGALNLSAETLSATNAAGLAASAPDPGASIFRVFGALILVVAIFLGGVWLYRNWQRLSVQRGGGAKLNLIEVKSLGQRQALYVVGYQQQRMLLASTPTGVTLVSHLPAAEEATEAASAPRLSFAEAFQHVLSRKQ
jgi:flagellar biogenesis protein FliO